MNRAIDKCSCLCQGTGWVMTCQDELIECGAHFEGQLHPDSKTLLLDVPHSLKEEERKSLLRWKIKMARQKILELGCSLTETKTELFNLELELINKTPTRKMPAVLDWSDILFDGSQQPAIEINKKDSK